MYRRGDFPEPGLENCVQEVDSESESPVKAFAEGDFRPILNEYLTRLYYVE